ncbi:MAG: transglutaminase-like domain-containing protein [Pirellulaceae bacterium]
MRSLCCAILAGWVLLAVSPAAAQFGGTDSTSSGGPEFGAERTQRWKVGMTVAAQAPCLDIFGTLPVPTNWPEQDVKVVEEQISASISQVRYRDLEGGIRQMLVAVPQLAVGEKVEALVIFEVTRRAIGLPTDPSSFRLPEKVPRDTRKYLAPSPLIDCRNRKIRDLAKEITADQEGAWQKVEAIHNWVKDNVQHTNDKAKGAVETLHEKRGHLEDLTGLFIALCRAEKIPARTVWVPDYCYAEFYLEDSAGKGYWFPCELKEKTVFGTVANDYLILQKGDNFEVPEKKEPQRFVKEFVKVKGMGRPQVSFVRQVMPVQ